MSGIWWGTIYWKPNLISIFMTEISEFNNSKKISSINKIHERKFTRNTLVKTVFWYLCSLTSAFWEMETQYKGGWTGVYSLISHQIASICSLYYFFSPLSSLPSHPTVSSFHPFSQLPPLIPASIPLLSSPVLAVHPSYEINGVMGRRRTICDHKSLII